MIKKIMLSVFAVLLLIPVVVNAGAPSRKIVVFSSNFKNDSARDTLIEKAGGIKIKDLDLIGGAAVYLPNRAAEKALLNHRDVLRVEDDLVITLSGKQAPSQPPQTTPWGITRVNAPDVWPTTTAPAVKVAVIDTGIDLSHPDLSANIKGGYNAISPSKSANDDNGHGTHVAGIIAAANNAIGVVGAAHEADLYAVKVLSRTGSGYLSDIIEGLDWAVSNGMNIVNMSLGTSSFSQSFADAVARVGEAGIVQVAAAGNSGSNDNTVNYPAKFPQVIAVSATDSADNAASFSSRGAEVDLAAPGVSIYSSYKGQTYRTLSGTSMASPHAAGVAALLLSNPSKCDTDLNGSCSPIEVLTRLTETATDLGTEGADHTYGYGLISASAAVL